MFIQLPLIWKYPYYLCYPASRDLLYRYMKNIHHGDMRHQRSFMATRQESLSLSSVFLSPWETSAIREERSLFAGYMYISVVVYTRYYFVLCSAHLLEFEHSWYSKIKCATACQCEIYVLIAFWLIDMTQSSNHSKLHCYMYEPSKDKTVQSARLCVPRECVYIVFSLTAICVSMITNNYGLLVCW